jgi:hypothetical protein
MCIGKFAILHVILVVRIVLCSTMITYAKIRKVEKGKEIVVEEENQFHFSENPI